MDLLSQQLNEFDIVWAKTIGRVSVGWTFRWKIENISDSWMKELKCIGSPLFVCRSQHNTKWRLMTCLLEDHIAIYLERRKDCFGPESITVQIEFAILDDKGKVMKKRTIPNYTFLKDKMAGFYNFETCENVFDIFRNKLLPKDTLRFQCSMWTTDQKSTMLECFNARTIFNENKRNFLCSIKDFTAIECGPVHSFQDSLIEFDIVVKEGLVFGKRLTLNITSFVKSVKYFSFKASIVTSEGEKENCCSQEYFADRIKVGDSCILLLARKLMDNKKLYLPDEVLTLDCECVFSNVITSFGNATITSK